MTSKVSVALTAEELVGLAGDGLRTVHPVGAVWLRGPDARRFANGMFTNNVRDLAVGGVNRHAMVDDRGRVEGFLDLLCTEPDTFLAVLDGVEPAAFLERYDKYVVFDDVELEPWSGVVSVRELGAPCAGTPSTITSGKHGWSYVSWGWPEPALRWVGPAGQAPVATARAEVLDAVSVLAGVPRFPDDTGPKGLPHVLGLRPTHLSFEKGCYLGQESINRIDVMGKVRKQLRAVEGAGVADGVDVEHQGTTVGRVSRSVRLPGPRIVGLAVLKEPAHEPGTSVSVGGMHATVRDLPVER